MDKKMVFILAAILSLTVYADEPNCEKKNGKEWVEIDKFIASPLSPKIKGEEAFKGHKGAPITIVVYSDFQCFYCSKGNSTLNELLDKYEGRLQVIFKHLPLDFHDQSTKAASYFEALRLQDNDLAFQFHDEVFKNQNELINGEEYLIDVSRKLGADINQLSRDVSSKKVKDRIKADKDEAKEFGFFGTPSFVVNGVPVKGAYPAKHFIKIIDRLEKPGC